MECGPFYAIPLGTTEKIPYATGCLTNASEYIYLLYVFQSDVYKDIFLFPWTSDAKHFHIGLVYILYEFELMVKDIFLIIIFLVKIAFRQDLVT